MVRQREPTRQTKACTSIHWLKSGCRSCRSLEEYVVTALHHEWGRTKAAFKPQCRCYFLKINQNQKAPSTASWRAFNSVKMHRGIDLQNTNWNS